MIISETQDLVGALLLGAICIGLWAWNQFREGKVKQQRLQKESWNYGSTVNNHDNEKRQYRTQEEADRVVGRMRRHGKDGTGRLNSYYNPDYGKWFVGNG